MRPSQLSSTGESPPWICSPRDRGAGAEQRTHPCIRSSDESRRTCSTDDGGRGKAGSMEKPFRWAVAPDGGRPSGRACAHVGVLVAPGASAPAQPPGCADCLRRGDRWVRLRRCVTCGYVGCCDTSRGRHAYAHHLLSGHPVALSLAPDEDWAWCFIDEVFLVRSPLQRVAGAMEPEGGT
ncbi:UBP-type zinc finger domain-containing protein [Streptomyces sp. NPDC051921]|uniref:UBP-type zinc finger domain-containing protein n=1 Tax=Streptomyces sp. NPDC051921 TaxID=3155806 RepID=UPI00343A9E92